MIFLTLWNFIIMFLLACIMYENTTCTYNLLLHTNNQSINTWINQSSGKYYSILQRSPKWLPLFKRSSYIGMVWKSNWKL